MPCYRPLRGYRCKFPNGNGKYPIVFKAGPSAYEAQEVPCGQCIGCRLARSLMWATRCYHESMGHDVNCFITLTYSPEFMPEDGSLVKRDFQLFLKRLRKSIAPVRVRFFMCGEYGEQLLRPHYHACLFGYDFADKELFSRSGGCDLSISESLGELWPFGFSTVGEFTFETAAYVARYCVKKVTGELAREHYERVDVETGELVLLQSEYTTMSRRPGIGRYWFEEFGDEVFPSDEVIINGKVASPPRYYADIFEFHDPEGMDFVRAKRKDFFAAHAADCTPKRLRVREVCKQAQVSSLKRSFEEFVE